MSPMDKVRVAPGSTLAINSLQNFYLSAGASETLPPHLIRYTPTVSATFVGCAKRGLRT